MIRRDCISSRFACAEICDNSIHENYGCCSKLCAHQKLPSKVCQKFLWLIGVGRFRILGGARFRILGRGARFKILGAQGLKYWGGQGGGQIPSRHMTS